MTSDRLQPKARAPRLHLALAVLALGQASCASEARAIRYDSRAPAAGLAPRSPAPSEPTWSRVVLDVVVEIAAGLTHVRLG